MLEGDHGYIKSHSGKVPGWKPKGESTTYKSKSLPFPTWDNAKIKCLNILYASAAP